MTTTSSAAGGKRPDLAAKLNAEICCEDLADRLGLVRPQQKGNFRSPHHPDKAPSVSVYQPDGGGPKRWKDWSTDEGGGPVDMVMWARGLDFPDAVKELARMYGMSVPAPAGGAPVVRREPTLAEWIAEKCIAAAKSDQKELLLNYLCGKEAGQRHLSVRVVEEGIKRGTIGLNTWTKPGAAPGEQGYGGLAAAFLVRSRLDRQVVGVDMRYIDPEANGGQKTQSQGEKVGAPWVLDWRHLANARTVVVVESAINALSVESCEMPGTAALAVRGTQTIDGGDWSFLRGKQVLLAFDNDHKPLESGEKKGFCPGPLAA